MPLERSDPTVAPLYRSTGGSEHVTPHWSVEMLEPSDPRLEALWTDLQARGGVGSPFLTWQWFRSLAEAPELSAGVRVIVVSRSRQPVGLLPLEWSRRGGSITTVGIAGWTWLSPDHLDVVSVEPPGEVARALLRHLISRSDWDAIDLDGLTPDGGLARAARELLRPPRIAPRKPENVIIPYVDLVDRDEVELLPGRKLRKRVRKHLAEAVADGGGCLLEVEPDRAASALDELMRLHQRRYGSVATAFSTPARRTFHKMAVARMAAAGMARIYRLSSGGRDVALEYDLVFDGKVYAYSAGIDPEARGSPGLALTGHIVLTAAAEGLREYDMLRGDEPYKLRFASGQRCDLRLRGLRLTPVSALRASGEVLRRRWPLRRG